MCGYRNCGRYVCTMIYNAVTIKDKYGVAASWTNWRVADKQCKMKEERQISDVITHFYAFMRSNNTKRIDAVK